MWPITWPSSNSSYLSLLFRSSQPGIPKTHQRITATTETRRERWRRNADEDEMSLLYFGADFKLESGIPFSHYNRAKVWKTLSLVVQCPCSQKPDRRSTPKASVAITGIFPGRLFLTCIQTESPGILIPGNTTYGAEKGSLQLVFGVSQGICHALSSLTMSALPTRYLRAQTKVSSIVAIFF